MIQNASSRWCSSEQPRIQRLTIAYSGAGLASLDLVGAVLRQGTFVEKMVRMGWTRPGRFDHSRDLAPLVRSVARYHAFLDLMQVVTTTLCVPTLVSVHELLIRFFFLTRSLQDIVGL